MKQTRWLMTLVAAAAIPLLSAVAQTPAPTGPPALSPSAAEVLKLAESGTSDDVLLAYVQNSPSPFNLSADQILYLKDVGASTQVVTAMLNRDATLRGQPQPYASAAPAPAPVPVPTAPPAAAPPPEAPPAYVGTPPPDVTYFYDDLSPYGSWVDLTGYGWCWQPTVCVINHGWRPYCDSGRWMWTDAGWFWTSDYTWGWAPFHYGRWFLHPNCGWVWTPDRVWGPAWVTWRTSDDICGWAPLPPHAAFDLHLGWTFNGARVGLNFDFGLRADHFNFIAMKDFCDRDLGHRRLPPVEVTRIYNRTTIVNNYVVQNNTIVNQGIKVERVAAATHTEIRRAAIRDLPAGSARVTRVTGSERTGAVVYRPQLKAPTRTVNMVAQKLDARHPVIQHTELAPVRAERGVAPGSYQPAARGNPRSSNDKSIPPRSDYSAPRARQSAPVAAAPAAPARQVNASRTSTRLVAPSAPASPARQVEEARTPVHVVSVPEPARAAAPVNPPRQTAFESKPATRALPGYQPPSATRTYPVRTTDLAKSETEKPGAAPSNTHVYYPKSYHQAADIRALPPLKTSREPASTTPDRSSASRSRKGD